MTTVGRWGALELLLESVRSSSAPGAVVAIANQSAAPVPASIVRQADVVVSSAGGISSGRNDAVAQLRDDTELISFPNDTCTFPFETLATAGRRFLELGRPAAMAGALREPTGTRFGLPTSGTVLTRWTVWRAIEPALFLAAALLPRRAPFSPELGSGSAGPWQAGEGTELLLRLLSQGEQILAVPEVVVNGPGERRALSDAEFRVKQRSYARGVGYVLRLHGASAWETALQVLLPWYRFVRPPAAGGRPRAGDCLAQSAGRLEGRVGRCFGGSQQLGATSLEK